MVCDTGDLSTEVFMSTLLMTKILPLSMIEKYRKRKDDEKDV